MLYDVAQFSYWLTVKGTEEERQAVYDALVEKGIIGDILEPSYAPECCDYCVPERFGTIAEQNEDRLDEIFHSIALSVPHAVLELEACNEDDKLSGYLVRFHGDLYQKSRSVTTTPPLREDGDIPFDQRKNLNMRTAKKLYYLCEEFEGKDGIREFSVLAISEDKKALGQLLAAKVAADAYGYFADKGLAPGNEADHVSSNFDSGFVEYYINDTPLLTRQEVLSLAEQEKGNERETGENPGLPETRKASLAEQLSSAETRKSMNSKPYNETGPVR